MSLILLSTWTSQGGYSEPLLLLALFLLTNFFLNMLDYPTSLILLSTWSFFFGWMSQGGHSEPLFLLALFNQSTPSCSKNMGWCGGGWWPMWFLCQPKFLILTLGLWTWAWQYNKSFTKIIIKVQPQTMQNDWTDWSKWSLLNKWSWKK